MKTAPFELRLAGSLEEALAQLAVLGGDARILAGGQTLMPLLRYRMARPQVLLDINRIAPLRRLEIADGLEIGALVRHSELERLPAGGPPLAQLLRRHAREIAFWPVRTRGTAVGSVVYADPKGDWPLLFCAVDAQVRIRGARGERSMAVRDFIRAPLEVDLAADELVLGLSVSEARAGLLRWGRSKLVHRAGEYAMCAALALQYGSGWECWLGATSERPVPLPGLSALLDSAAGMPPARMRLLEAAEADILAAQIEMDATQRYRHAGNAADAAIDAFKEKHHG
ncbi:MAG: FAD binding domain-containing protein [Noviherbaspirillum sp.]